VKQHLGRQSGVQKVDVSLIDGKVDVTPMEDGQIDPAQLLKAVYDSGVSVAEMDVTARGKIATRVFLCSLFLLSFEVKPKLTSNSETDVAADGHEHGAPRMRNLPVHAEPHVHSGAHAHVRRDSGE